MPLLPQDFSSADGFLDAISSAWHREWQRVYSTDRGDTVPFRDAGVDYQVVYTPSIKFWSVFTQGEAHGFVCVLLARVCSCAVARLAQDSTLCSNARPCRMSQQIRTHAGATAVTGRSRLNERWCSPGCVLAIHA